MFMHRKRQPQLRKPAITIVMPVYNGTATLDSAIRSIQNQTLDAWELVLVDDASSDDLRSIVTPFGDPRIQVVHNTANLGLAASLNRAVEIATAPYIARMDADDVSYPERLERQYDFMEKHHSVDLVGSGALVFKAMGEAIGIMPATATHQAICDGGLTGAFPLHHPTWMGKKEWFRRHSYDPLFSKAQDYELLLRASRTSNYANVQEILLGYRWEESRLRKRLLTRHFVLKALAKNMFRRGGQLDFLRGALSTCAKGMGDVALSVGRTGLPEKLRFMPVPPHEKVRWSNVWRAATN